MFRDEETGVVESRSRGRVERRRRTVETRDLLTPYKYGNIHRRKWFLWGGKGKVGELLVTSLVLKQISCGDKMEGVEWNNIP